MIEIQESSLAFRVSSTGPELADSASIDGFAKVTFDFENTADDGTGVAAPDDLAISEIVGLVSFLAEGGAGVSELGAGETALTGSLADGAVVVAAVEVDTVEPGSVVALPAKDSDMI